MSHRGDVLPLTLMMGNHIPLEGLNTKTLGGTIMNSIINKKMTKPVAVWIVLALCVSMFSAPAMAQRVAVHPPGPGYGGRPYGPPPPYYRRPSDFDRTLAVVGTVGAIAAVASARNNHYYYRQPTVVVAAPRPTVVVRTQPSPIIVERPVVVEKQVIVEKPVVVERQVSVVVGAEDSYSPKLGASFRIENMQIPGYKFTAARLTSDPQPNSPLHGIGLRKGDVITRLNDSPADTLAELERHDNNTLIRYIKTGTTKVLLANVFIPAHGGEIYHAP
jgi:hypothetical protein